MATIIEEFAEILHASNGSASAKLGLHLLDTLGAWLAGARTEDSAALQRLAKTSPGFPPAFGDNPLDQIALRVATIRNTEIDDIHMESCTTPGSVVVPVALTLAAIRGTPSAAAFAQGLAAGYEAMIRLSLAVSGATILYRGVWATFFAAPVSAAATAAALIGLDAARTADALAIALSLSSGAPGGPSAPSPRWLLLGQAARAGVFAALAAASGYRGDRSVLDGDWLERTHGIACNRAALVAPRDAEGVIAAVSYKPYCAAKQVTAALDGFRRLLADAAPAEIAAVRVTVPPSYAGMIGHRHAGRGRVERITCAAYQLALAAYRPDLLDDVIRPDLSGEASIAAFMARVEVAADPGLAAYFPKSYPARIELSLAGGAKRDVLVVDALGDPALSLDEAALRAKFHRLADPVIGEGPAETLAAAAVAAVTSDAALATLGQAIATSEALG